MAKRRRKKKFSNFHIKALQSYKVLPSEDTITLANLRDPRLTRTDGGQVRPVFYDENLNVSFVSN